MTATPNTVYVIGAGASAEVGMPTGEELKTTICELLDVSSGDRGLMIEDLNRITSHLRDQSNSTGDLYQAAHQIKESLHLVTSIDNYIDTQKEHRNEKAIELCAKLAIAKAILNAEHKCRLIRKDKFGDCYANLSEVRNTWYAEFFKLLTENCNYQEFKKRITVITLIVFNYDRCIEYYLLHAIMQLYDVDAISAYETLTSIKIYHPYGSLGGILQSGSDNRAVEFGMRAGSIKLLEIAQKLKTFTEGVDPNESQINEIRQAINVADRVVFLGFAFHDINMRLITNTREIEVKKAIPCYATAYCVSHPNQKDIKWAVVRSLFKNALKPTPIAEHMDRVYLYDGKCYDLFGEYRKSLGFPMPERAS